MGCAATMESVEASGLLNPRNQDGISFKHGMRYVLMSIQCECCDRFEPMLVDLLIPTGLTLYNPLLVMLSLQLMLKDAVVEGRLFDGTLMSDGDVLKRMVSAAKISQGGDDESDWMAAPLFKVNGSNSIQYWFRGEQFLMSMNT